MSSKKGGENKEVYIGACEACGHKKVCGKVSDYTRICADFVTQTAKDMKYGGYEAHEAIYRMIRGEVLKQRYPDDEDDLMLVWFSPCCSCFHYSYNKVFMGIYTQSFINLVSANQDEVQRGCTYRVKENNK